MQTIKSSRDSLGASYRDGSRGRNSRQTTCFRVKFRVKDLIERLKRPEVAIFPGRMGGWCAQGGKARERTKHYLPKPQNRNLAQRLTHSAVE
jgi:hypothetical protein